MPPAALTELITQNGVLLFIVFLFVIFLLYRLMKLALKAAIIAAAGFAFPWIVQYFGWFEITANVATGLQFALLAIGALLAYEFIHFIVFFGKVMTWPFRFLAGRTQKQELRRLRKEVAEIEKKKER